MRNNQMYTKWSAGNVFGECRTRRYSDVAIYSFKFFLLFSSPFRRRAIVGLCKHFAIGKLNFMSSRFQFVMFLCCWSALGFRSHYCLSGDSGSRREWKLRTLFIATLALSRLPKKEKYFASQTNVEIGQRPPMNGLSIGSNEHASDDRIELPMSCCVQRRTTSVCVCISRIEVIALRSGFCTDRLLISIKALWFAKSEANVGVRERRRFSNETGCGEAINHFH